MDTALAPSPATLDAFLGRWRDADGSERANYQLAGALPLRANAAISSRGVQLIGSGFIVTPEQATALGLGRIPPPGAAYPPVPQRQGPDRDPAQRPGHRPVRSERGAGARPFPGSLSVVGEGRFT